MSVRCRTECLGYARCMRKSGLYALQALQT